MKKLINVNSEIGKLKAVILHRPGKEIENFTPEMMPQLLFDETPYLPVAQKEHDEFANVLRKHGAKVLYIERLAAEAITNDQIKNNFLEEMLKESGYAQGPIHDALKQYLLSMNNQDMINTLIAGVRTKDLHMDFKHSFSNAERGKFPFYLYPMPNLYFTRDTSACIGQGVSINRMTFPARRRESLFNELIIKHHPDFKHCHIPIWRGRYHRHSHIEGGDEQVLNDHVMAVGISQRTSTPAIKGIAKNLFKNSHFDTVLAVHIPHNHALMHLDTVFTMINYDQFTVYPGIFKGKSLIDTWTITPNGKGGLNYQYDNNLRRALKRVLGLSQIDFIYTGNDDPIQATREQWNDGSNTLAIAPGVVITYDRNTISNHMLKLHGIRVITIPSSELSRGRGGPRCMSCPLYRMDLKN